MRGTPAEHRTLDLDGTVLPYELRRSDRRTLGITVEADGRLVVTAPRTALPLEINRVLRRRRLWIRRRMREATLRPPPASPREWVSGETHRYLGRQYRLTVVRGRSPRVTLSGRFLRVVTPEPQLKEQVRRLVERWYLDHAREVFERRTLMLIQRTPRLRLDATPPIFLRRLQKRWGSCSTQGRILLNVDAVKLPVTCIDYLLMHELCHLRVPNHGAAFWRRLDACMPDWERWRNRLASAEI